MKVKTQLDLVWLGMDEVYVISIIVSYSMPNPIYTYIVNICMTSEHILVITFLNEPELFFVYI